MSNVFVDVNVGAKNHNLNSPLSLDTKCTIYICVCVFTYVYVYKNNDYLSIICRISQSLRNDRKIKTVKFFFFFFFFFFCEVFFFFFVC